VEIVVSIDQYCCVLSLLTYPVKMISPKNLRSAVCVILDYSVLGNAFPCCAF
jgi:hypothetical protein